MAEPVAEPVELTGQAKQRSSGDSRGDQTAQRRTTDAAEQPVDRPNLTGQAKRGAVRRDAIVDAALTVFARRGYRDGSLADVAESVGLSAAGILYHFGSKEGLLLAVIAERDRRAAASGETELTGLPALLAAMDATALQCEGERPLAALHTVLGVESLDPDAVTHGYFLQRSRVLRAGIAFRLREAQELGQVRADVDVDAKAAEVVAFLEGAAVVWLLDDETSLVTLYRNYFTDLSAALAPTEGDR